MMLVIRESGLTNGLCNPKNWLYSLPSAYCITYRCLNHSLPSILFIHWDGPLANFRKKYALTYTHTYLLIHISTYICTFTYVYPYLCISDFSKSYRGPKSNHVSILTRKRNQTHDRLLLTCIQRNKLSTEYTCVRCGCEDVATIFKINKQTYLKILYHSSYYITYQSIYWSIHAV